MLVMKTLERAMLENDLRARSSVARFAMLSAVEPEPVQMTFGMPLAVLPQAHEPDECSHVGTGREPQARLFGGGFDSVCSRCGRIPNDMGSPAFD
jgi:hypothetical protein